MLDAYEIGLKADLFDNLLRVNLAAFHYDHSNLQVSAVNPSGSPSLLNAAENKVDGIFAELTLAPPLETGYLQIRASLSYLDARYDSFPRAQFYFPNPGGGQTSVLGDATGNRSVQSPEFTSSISVDYEVPAGQFGTFGLSGTWAYNDGFFWTPQNAVRQEAFSLVSAQLYLTSPDERWRLRIYGRNLLDEEHFIYVSRGGSNNAGAAAPPRTFGAAVSASF